MQEIYQEPIKPELIERASGDQGRRVTSAASVTPQRTAALLAHILRAELDMLVIQGTVVSAEHVSKTAEPLNLKKFIRELEIPVIVGGCASYQAALHLMRTGAAGVLVGVGPGPRLHHPRRARHRRAPGHRHRRRPGARMRHLDETGVYVHVIADGGMGTGGDIAKAIVCGADAVMIGSPLAAASRGARPGLPLGHGHLPPHAAPRRRVKTQRSGHARGDPRSARPTRTTAA